MASMKLVKIASADDLSPIQCQAISWTNVDLLSNRYEQSSVKFQYRYNDFHSGKCIWKCGLQNVIHFESVWIWHFSIGFQRSSWQKTGAFISQVGNHGNTGPRQGWDLWYLGALMGVGKYGRGNLGSSDRVWNFTVYYFYWWKFTWITLFSSLSFFVILFLCCNQWVKATEMYHVGFCIRWDVIEQVLVRSQNCEIGSLNSSIPLIFDWHLGGSTAERPVNFQSNQTILSTNLWVSSLLEILW